MVYDWQSEGGTKKSTTDDMVLLTKISEAAITENLKKRLMGDKIYTYIGPVLVAVNPFKQLPYFGEKEIGMYQGAAQYEVPPHIYALADSMYRNMLIDSDSQCVIISGESGAGKTVSAKYIMNYITKVSGGKGRVQKVKEIILESNPLLEAFGNAKTLRNNNSSRFGKYVEIQFSKGGEPVGGKVSNFLLEKSRVHFLNKGERNFHIFYQLCSGASPDMQRNLGIDCPDYFNYLNQSGVYTVDGTNDAHDFQETLKAMSIMGIDKTTETEMLRVVAAILHMSNITFVEDGNNTLIEDPKFLEYPSYLLGISAQSLGQKLTSRVFDSKWGGKSDKVDMVLNCEQAKFTRDAWAKGLYSRLFEYIVKKVNIAMVTDSKEISIGILDIYGFEIFEKNGFEQYCINYVNEKLQQIFIELTLKNEQEEYEAEGIKWKPIQYFNNKIVCDIIESKRPPGIMCILDDTCATMTAVCEGADKDFKRKMDSQIGDNPHYSTFRDGFVIKHYAGSVSYHVEGFCEKNRDVLFVDIIEVMQQSSSPFIRSIFPDNIESASKGRPTTAGLKIRSQANELVKTLMTCIPHYIRCIKPNETKKARDFDVGRVTHQVEYLGLKENIKIKRAGFAYRRPYQKFLQRYAILTSKTWPSWQGDPVEGIKVIMDSVDMDLRQYQIGRTKIFVKDPESLYMLEECRERKYDHHARIIQQAFKKHYSKHHYLLERQEASNLLLNRKQRRINTLNRNFHSGDYIGVEYKPGLSSLVPHKEKVEFSLTVTKYDRRFRPQKRDLILTKNTMYLVGREPVKNGPDKGQIKEVVKRKISLDNITQLTLSPYPDDLVLLHVKDDYESLLEIRLKTEFIMILNRKLKDRCKRELPLNFIPRYEYRVRKTGWGGGGVRKVNFIEGSSFEAVLTPSGSTLSVSIGHGLPSSTQPTARRVVDTEAKRLHQQFRSQSSQQRPQHSLPKTNPNIRSSPNGGIYANKTSGSDVRTPPTRPINPSFHRQTTNNSSIQRRPPEALPSNTQTRISHPRPIVQTINRTPPPPPQEPAPPDQLTIDTSTLNISHGTTHPSVPPRPNLAPKPQKLPTVTATYSYDARDTDELTFQVGDIMELINEDKSGWSTCNFRGKQGFCPANYITKN